MIPYTVTLAEGQDARPFGFVNVQLGAGGGHTLGFWSNKNGQALFGADDLSAMVALNLRNLSGAHFDPADYKAFRTWILDAKATNIAYMLSAQLAAMKLNVMNEFVSGSSIIWVAPYTFTSVNTLMSDANTSLGLYGLTPSGHAEHVYQELLKTTLDNANNNFNFVLPAPIP